MKKMLHKLGTMARRALLFLTAVTVVVALLEMYEKDKSDWETAFHEASKEDTVAE